MSTEIKQEHNLKTLKRHTQYYQSGGDLIVIVENTSFRVASVFFTRESEDFKDRLAESAKAADPTNASKNTENDGRTVHTIVIASSENVTAEDFAQLCWVFFNEKLSVYETTLTAWKTILRLANQWNFAEVKDLAFREINAPGKFDIPLVDRIVLYTEHKASFSYIEPLYVDLLSRATHLSLDEASALGLETVLKISAARENLRLSLTEPLAPSEPLPGKIRRAVYEVVREMFGQDVFFGADKLVDGVNGRISSIPVTAKVPPASGVSRPAWGSATSPSTLAAGLGTASSPTTNGGATNGSSSHDADGSELGDDPKKKNKKNKKGRGVSVYDYDDFYDI